MARRKRVPIVKITVDGAEVDAKECTKCGEVKALTEFYKRGSGLTSRCTECDRKYKTESRKRLNPSGARRKCTKWTTEMFGAFVREVTNGEYILAGEYMGALVQVEIQHLACGGTRRIRPSQFISYRHQCQRCVLRNLRKSNESFLTEVSTITGGEYTVLGKYINNTTPVLMRHNMCGNEWQISPNHFLSAESRCTVCTPSKISNGERRISAYLEAQGHAAECEYRLSACRDKRPLPFDFAVLLSDRTVLIEYDGIQHFSPRGFGVGKEQALLKLRETQRHDRIKTEYCRANGIPLIRIDYTQYDEIEEILTQELTKLGVIGKHPITEGDAQAA